jgi:uncharacterized protein (TIGR03032 family)
MSTQPSSPQTDPSQLPLRSVHTNTFPPILNQLGISLVVSTYQAGKLIVLRADGEVINTHFKVFNKPMGLAADQHKLALGTAYQVWELRNQPAVTQRLQPPDQHDACYLPRQIYITGDIDIHEMAWVGEELWFINTRFSCLCTLDKEYSFVPQWRPPFISAYDLQDRCHLNGLAVRDGKPRYVTALGATDTPNGWRQNKANGGILMDITTNEILVQGLSMPHSPRWYQGKLWVLESGKGSLAWVDLANGKVQEVAKLPGFTRGIDFWGDLAFIGLSQVRESAVFSGIPLTQTLSERICGVWVVNIKTGETLAFLRFEEAVQEIFGVAVLPGIRFPEVIDWDEGLLGGSYVLPDFALAEAVSPPAKTESAHACFNQGNELYYNRDLVGAIALFRKALELQPDYLPARYNLGVVLGDMEQYEEAIFQLQQVVTAEASHADAYNSLGFVYSKQKQLLEALHCYRRATQIRPNFAKAHHNLGMTLLQIGEYPSGWAQSEWRWQTDQFHPFQCPQPRWEGQEIPNQTLLIHTEQGAGDAIQFIRFIPQAAQRCGKIILVCTPELLPLFQSVAGIDQLRTAGDIPVSAFDYFTPLMSLPHLLGNTLDTIPQDIPYLQVETANPNLLSTASMQNPQLKVGVVWGGSPTQANDKNRSCQLADFLSLLRLPDIAFYSLQKGERTVELAELPTNIGLQDLSGSLNTYADTAQVIQQLDLVITVDTSVAHLAGALGKPVWTLLCYNPDWRWLLEREDTPWYPTMRLFRQSNPGDWKGVFKRVKQELQRLRDGKPPQRQRKPKLAVDSFVVIVPVFNMAEKQDIFRKTIASINYSIGVFQRHYAHAKHITWEVVLVNDGSTDTTAEILQNITQQRNNYRLITHATNRGQAAARNTGVKQSKGTAIFFCDADDLFQDTHILHAITFLNQPTSQPATPQQQKLEGYPAAIKTGVYTQDTLHPEWKQRLENTLCLNLCIRREAHDFMGGFPEDEIFQEFTYKNEDWAYTVWLHKCFQVLSLPIETVEYVRHPGNLFDHQLQRFQRPPGTYQEELSQRDQELMAQVEQFIQQRGEQLHQQVRGVAF